ncbi:hypothetical protein AMATHDRAFT_3314 [Amanita thiersii Skay4041]|uniref:Uncharacterized protein n=1 Tax=Amanita thiersii Skay4041 TaxID=703135 RepID=A0A2A9NU57_9AGAR|nr:hypothetical protein AMATHDRAFT_3314 [Amanita thiersii Skay4041]
MSILPSASRQTRTIAHNSIGSSRQSHSAANARLQIFDIFDVPTQPTEYSRMIRQQAVESSPSPLRQPRTPEDSRSRPLPAPLPPPIIFDGPARPIDHVHTLRRRQFSKKTPSSKSLKYPFPHSDLPPPQMFKGPARATHSYGPHTEAPLNMKGAAVLLGVAGAAGILAVSKIQQDSRNGSPGVNIIPRDN